MKRVIISGGGTGGHIFPAIAIADELTSRFPDINILFVGARGKMEMEKVPQSGYKIVGLPIVGLQRNFTLSGILKNLLLPFYVLRSLWIAYKIVRKFNPQIVVGVGGYASGPTLKIASMLKIPTLLQEQNSFAGKTNQLLAKKARAICVAYAGMDRFFPRDKIVMTGNPVRKNVWQIAGKRQKASELFDLSLDRPCVLIAGGALCSKTLNEVIFSAIETLQKHRINVLWQCGSYYYKELCDRLNDTNMDGVRLYAFIGEMDMAYAVADLIVSRAGAIAISELCLVGKATLLVPSPNVSEDHQTHNANALVKKHAAIKVPDDMASKLLIDELMSLINNPKKMDELSGNIRALGKPDATKDIVQTLVQVVG